jgi:hypothetical protein
VAPVPSKVAFRGALAIAVIAAGLGLGATAFAQAGDGGGGQSGPVDYRVPATAA